MYPNHHIIPTFLKNIFRSIAMILFMVTAFIFPSIAQQTFSTAGGPFTYNVPVGVTMLKVECWGAGGGGSSVTSTGRAGGGGGGGAFASKVITVSQSSYALTVGAGGSANTKGGDTYFNTSEVFAVGGNGATSNNNARGTGGADTGCTGTTTRSGGDGANGVNGSYSGGGGGGAGSYVIGQAASGSTGGAASSLYGGAGANGRTSGSNGQTGSVYGGGGSGAYTSNSSNFTGGSGANGMVIVTPCLVEVNATAGVTLDYYATVNAAVDAINNGVHQGAIIIKMLASTTETAQISLNASGNGSASYTSVTLYPTATGQSISGNFNGPLFTSNGSGSLTIDGRVNGIGTTPSLALTNTSTATTASTVQFSNSAQNNILKYCTVSGGAVTTSTTGTIVFGTGTNSNNTVSNCTITNNGTRRQYGLYSNTSTNTSNTITNNTFKDVWLTSASSYSIYLANASAWTITGNSFFDTGVATLTNTSTYSAIYVNAGNSYSISNNYIGGTAVNCGGSSMSMGTSSAVSTVFNPIYLNLGNTTSTVQSNVIQNITYKSSNTAPFSAITVAAGAVDVTSNTIGDPNGTANLIITAGVTGVTTNGINLTSNATLNVTSNTLSGITLAGSTGTFAHNFNGIICSGSGTFSITGNTIGHASTASSVSITSTGTGTVQTLYGINSAGSGSVTISDNTVANLANATNNTNTGTAGTATGILSSAGVNNVSGNTVHHISIANGSISLTTPSVCGVMLTSTYAGKIVSGNLVHNLSNSYASGAVNVVGLYYGGATTGTNTVEKNQIYGLSATSTSGIVRGLQIASGATTYSNNIISLSNDLSNVVYGAFDAGSSAGSTCNFYHNSVYLGGTTTGSVNSFAYYSATSSNTRNYRSNIFFNARSSSLANYAIYYVSTSVGNLTADYNDYRVTGTNGVVGYFNSTAQTLISLRTAMGKDANSIDTDPGFVNAGGTVAVDYKTQIQLVGTSTGITVDFNNGTRYSYTMGAWELLPVVVWQNGTSVAAYGNLKTAFDRINDGTWTGNIKIVMVGSTVETASAELNASGSGSASYTRVTLYPEASDIVVSGNFNAPVVNLKGTKNVYINGSVYLNNTSPDLTFTNSNTGANASVILFSDSAQNNSINYCHLVGNPLSSSLGIVTFSTTAAGMTNKLDTIAHCEIFGIGTSSTTRPYNAIYANSSLGTNTDIQILNNEIYDFFNPNVASNGIYIGANSTKFTLSGNSFFETTAFSSTAAVAYTVININNSTGGGYAVSNNYFGGNSAASVGSWTKSGNNNEFIIMRLNVGAADRTSIQGNTVKGFNYSNSANANWYIINILAGGVDVGTTVGNTFGANSGENSIYLTNATNGGTFYGIYSASTSVITIDNNLFGSISVGSGNGALAYNFYGIYKASGAGIFNVRDNQIGGLNTVNSLIARSTATANAQRVIGVYSEGTDSVLIKGNTIANLVNATTSNVVAMTRGIMTIAGSNTIDYNIVHDVFTLNSQANNFNNATLIGIEQISEQAGSTQRIRGNQVYSLRNRTLATIEMYGIFYKGPSTGTHEISRNFVHTFIIISTDAAYLHGISLHTGTYTCSNNVVFLGDTITTGCHVWGIWNNSNSEVQIYHNTVYLNGSIPANKGISNSFAYRDISSAPTNRNIRNNIFWNARKNAEQISHFALYLNSTVNTTLDYNDYQFAEKFGIAAGVEYASLLEWTNALPFDDNSVEIDPALTNLGGISPSDYQTGVQLTGTPISSQPSDYGFLTRSETAPTMGAWEFVADPVEIWNGLLHRQDVKTLKMAFDTINSGKWTGDLTIKIKSNIRETAPAVLYQSGYTGGGGTSNYTRVHIYPTRADLQVFGKLASAIVELNGADGVVLDGRVNGVGAPYGLTIKNDSVSTAASTVLFKNSAQGDTLKYCLIKGLTTNPNGGIVHFSTSTAGTGNDNNCILNNKITVVDSDPALKSRVINAVYSEGSSGMVNDGNKISNNEIFDVWSQAVSSYGIHIGPYSSAFTLSGNSIYESTTFTPSAANTYNGIRINNASGDGFVLSGNFIGGKAVQCQGSPLLIGTTTPAHLFALQPIYLNVGATTATSVQGNFINNFRLTSPNTAPFSGIFVNAGAVNIGTVTGNTIGAATGIESIYLIGVSAASSSYGVYVNSPAAVSISNNTIGSISTNVTGSTSYGHNFYGIYKGAVAGDFSVAGNVIGSLSTASSIQAVSAATTNAQSVYGIYSLGSGATTIYNNTIANLNDNTTFNSASSNVEAIYFGGNVASTNTIERNFIYGLTHGCTTSSASNLMAGIHLAGGSANVINNIIWIGNGVTNNFWVYGIYDQGVASQTNAIYHNTVYLSGTPSGTTRSSFAYLKSANLGTTNIRNNIFFNDRSGGFTGKHYALSIPGLTNLTMDANDYYCSVGTFRNFYVSEITSLATWRTNTGKDGSAVNALPFSDPAAALAINFRPMLDLPGLNASIGYDYGLNPRNATTPTIGAWERVNKWKGNISIDFNTPANWTFNMVPAVYDNIIFDDAPQRPCTMDQDRYVTDIVNNQATHRFVVNGFSLYIKGNLTFTNGAQVDASANGSTLVFNGLSAQTIPSGSLYTNKVYNLQINNSNHVTLYGTLVLLNNFTSALGKLNAFSSGTTFTYGGTAAQTIEGNLFLNEKVYNLAINNPAGVTLNTTFTADNDMSIQAGASFIIPETKGLKVTGNLTNSSSASSLLLKSSATGTASLIQSNAGPLATVQRYIDGDTLAWHFMSSPVASQTISGSWTPAGTYGDGTGYDLYLWDEPNACWVYNLNTDSIPAWSVANPGNTFVPGRGYLYAVQAFTPTKQFVGNLNGGTLTRALTINAAGVYQGFNLLGNPYPSSIDWSLGSGFNRNMLYLNGSGYDIWTWSPTANNYGVYNSADVSGTNNVTRYIAPMQAFFVRASSAGTFSFKNDARVHDGASVWLKSAKTNDEAQHIQLKVASSAGSDEVRFGFGYPVNESGAMKLFSPVETAPSLYMNCSGGSFTTRRLTDTVRNKYVPINFKAGQAGTYTLNCTYDATAMGTIFLEDRQNGTILDLSGGDSYTFQASVTDATERFILHFGAVTPVDNGVHPNVWVSDGVLNVYLENMIGDYTMRLFDLQGRQIQYRKLSGSEQCSVPLFGKGFYLVKVESKTKSQSIKVLY